MRITNNDKLDKRYKFTFKKLFRITVMVLIGLFIMWVANWFYLNGDRLKGNVETASVEQDVAVPTLHNAEQEVVDVYSGVSFKDSGSVVVSAFVLSPTYPTGHQERHQVISKYLEILGETEIDTWNRILDCESGAVNGYNAHDLDIKNSSNGISGIWQITNETWSYAKCSEGHNWLEQTECAIKVRDLQGWSAWECY